MIVKDSWDFRRNIWLSFDRGLSTECLHTDPLSLECHRSESPSMSVSGLDFVKEKTMHDAWRMKVRSLILKLAAVTSQKTPENEFFHSCTLGLQLLRHPGN